MSFDAKTLYELLPAIYRIRDAEQGEPLRELLSVIAEQVAAIEEDLDQLYDDQFIETCAEWVVPYIGDLIGVRTPHGGAPGISSPRAEVANTIALRRRKGTAAAVEEIARDVTGWPARVVEFFELLGWTQYMQHVRVTPPRGAYASVRDHDACELITSSIGAFDSTAHTADVRRIGPGRGRYNIRNAGLFLWRLKSYPIPRSDARKIADGCYTFNPVGLDAPLFNNPVAETGIAHLAEEINVPAPLRRRPLYDELKSLRGSGGEAPHFGESPVLRVFQGGDEILASQIAICNLSGPAPWRRPLASQNAIRAAVDPVLGRIALRDASPANVEAGYSYGFSAEMGGGPYHRGGSAAQALNRTPTWHAWVSRHAPPLADHGFNSLADAVQRWNQQPAGIVGVIAIMDSATYAESLTGINHIRIPEGGKLVIVAAELENPTDSEFGPVSADGLRPHLLGDVAVAGIGGTENPGELVLNGLLIEGSVIVLPGSLGALDIVHGTIVPGKGSLKVEAAPDEDAGNVELKLTLDHVICGAISLSPRVPSLTVSNSLVSSGVSIVGSGGQSIPAITAAGAELEVRNSTIFGKTSVRTLEAANTIFTGRVDTLRVQTGCARFSYLPPESRSPRRYRCQPESSVDATRVAPQFESLVYGNAAYGQLSRRSAVEITQGADDEAEMGAFHDLFQSQRETNLRIRLEEYLRFGLEAGVFFVT